jgi:hypothetical protein
VNKHRRRPQAVVDRRAIAGRASPPPKFDLGQLAWMDRAACAGAGPQLFYADFDQRFNRLPPLAVKTCVGCPVRQQCLDYALARNERFGIWGGLSYRQRVQLRRADDVQRPALYRQMLVANCQRASVALPKELCQAS